MPEESLTPDLTERVQEVFDALNGRDFDALTSLCAPDAVYESVAMGATFDGVAAIREFCEDMVGTYEGFDANIEESLDLGNGVGLAVVNQKGRPSGGSVDARMRYAAVSVWVADLLVRITMYTDIGDARAAAERLARDRGQAVSREKVSANLDLVRSIVGPWERGDYSSVGWADPEIEYVHVAGPAPGSWSGIAGMAEGWREMLSVMTGHRVQAYEFRELDGDRVLVLFHLRGLGRTSGVDLGQIQAKVATLFHIDGGRVTRLVNYLDRDRALADLELEE